MFSSALKKILNSPYINNKGGSHELFTKNILIGEGFKEVSNNDIKFNSVEFWKNHSLQNWEKASNIPNNSVISQPFGSQKTPDKIIKYKNILLPWEDKSSKDTKPTYNGGLPKLECLYVFTSEKHNKTTIFQGKDIITKEKRERLLNLFEKHKKIDEEFNMNEQKTENDPFERGFIFYTRAMYDQRCRHLTCSNDYFLHPQRENIEKKIIDWALKVDSTDI